MKKCCKTTRQFLDEAHHRILSFFSRKRDWQKGDPQTHNTEDNKPPKLTIAAVTTNPQQRRLTQWHIVDVSSLLQGCSRNTEVWDNHLSHFISNLPIVARNACFFDAHGNIMIHVHACYWQAVTTNECVCVCVVRSCSVQLVILANLTC